jgi:hypothetical protein
MKSPSVLEPEFTAEDWAIVDGIEAGVEKYLQDHPDSTHVNFVPNAQPEWKRRHWNEVVRRLRAAGWVVKVNDTVSNILVTRPPLGEVATAVRFTHGRPATNLTTLVDMIGPTPIEGILDVYLDDRGVGTLLTMHRLGATFSPRVRLLTSSKGAKHLSKSFVADAFTEMGCQQGEARITSANSHEGRLLLLAGRGVIGLGCSLNNFNVNERPSRGGDRGEWGDFETRWQAATPL